MKKRTIQIVFRVLETVAAILRELKAPKGRDRQVMSDSHRHV